MNDRKRINIISIIFICLFSSLVITPEQCLALEGATHRAINQYIAKGTSFDEYLKKQLEMKGGVESSINQKKIWELCGDGGEEEDDGARPLNHFYDPITNKGLSVKGRSVGDSALVWATLPVGKQNFSWDDVRTYYRDALTAQDKTKRETNFAKTFRGLGQLMHLVQDMSIPAHVRNDDHLYIPFIPIVANGDPYEKWAEKSINQNTPFSTKYPAYAYEPYNEDSFLIPKLFDSGQYPDTENTLDPNITVSKKNIGLAEYTNANFLSNGTIFEDFDYPSYNPGISMSENPTTICGKRVLYLKKIGEGETINHFARAGRFREKLPAEYKELNLTIKDDNIHQDYADLLIPRAIGYSSQLLQYFFRGRLDVELGDGNIKIKNASNEIISSGKFRLYYDNTEGVRTPLTDPVDANTLEKGSGEQTIIFNKPEGAKSYTLVYEGQLGAEPNAVIGKFIPAENELVVFTVSLAGIAGENLTKKAVLVWNDQNNRLERTPVDYEDTSFQEWYAGKTNIGKNMFGNFIHDNVHPHKLAPALNDTQNMDYHADQGSARIPPNGYFYSRIFPQTIYSSVLLSPQTPVTYAGLRTSSELVSNSLSGTSYIYCWPPPDHKDTLLEIPYSGGSLDEYIASMQPYYEEEYDFGMGMGFVGATSYVTKYEFYGLLGKFDIDFQETIHRSGRYDAITNMYPYEETINKIFIPDWPMFANRYQTWTDREWYIYSRSWYNNYISGKYSDNTITNLSLIQYTPCTYEEYNEENVVILKYWTFDRRHILVQAQAIYRQNGVDGYEWVAAGRNAALETQIIAAINMAYSLNDIPENEIRNTSISIEIVK